MSRTDELTEIDAAPRPNRPAELSVSGPVISARPKVKRALISAPALSCGRLLFVDAGPGGGEARLWTADLTIELVKFC